MTACPICGEQLGSPVCGCGYDRSRDYAAYPTFAPLPPDTPTFEALYNDDPERTALVRCPDCGRETLFYEYQDAPKCACGARLNPTDYFSIQYQKFQHIYQVRDRLKNAISNHEKLLAIAEKALSVIRYASPDTAENFSNVLFELSLFAHSGPFARILAPFDPLYGKFTDAIMKKEPGHSIFDDQEEESQYRKEIRNQIARDAGFRRLRGVWHYPPFHIEEYRRHTQSQLYRDAAAAEAEGDYRTLYEILREHWNDGCPSDSNPYALTYLALLYHYGRGCEQDRDWAADVFSIAAENGNPLAAAWICEYYRMGYVVKKDPEFANRLHAAVEPELWKLCEAGDAEAQYFLGYNLSYGIYEKKDPQAAAELLTKALHQGHRSAAVELAYCFYDGDGVEKDRSAAFTLLTQYPIPADSRKAQYLLGLCHYWGNGTARNYDLAFPCFKRAAELGHAKSKNYLADCYRLGEGTEVNYAEAVRWYHDAADNHKDTEAAFYLGFLYSEGRDVIKSPRTAVRYWRIAAEAGNAAAQNQLGFAYMEGNGVAADQERSRFWFRKAADANYAPAQFWLGYLYLMDDDSTHHQEGLALLTQSAEAGHDWSQYKLGHLYELGYRVPANHQEAAKWYQKAADQGHTDALYALGMLLMDGRGTARDTDKGLGCLTKAADAGHRPAARELAEHYHRGITHNEGYFYVCPDLARKYALLAVEDETDGKAQYLMGRILHYDLHNPDPEGAMAWYRKAIQNKCGEARLELSKSLIGLRKNLDEAWNLLCDKDLPVTGEVWYWRSLCLENGWGTPKNKKLARQYYNTAIEKGYVDNTPKRKKRFGLF